MLLPHKFRIPGFILVILGITGTVMYFGFNFRFKVPVFAVASSFLETKFLTTIKTNFADELIMLLFLCGFALIVFSREKTELISFETIRYKSFRAAFMANIIILSFSVLFVYGGGFIAILILNIILPGILYLIIFNILKIKELKRTGTHLNKV